MKCGSGRSSWKNSSGPIQALFDSSSWSLVFLLWATESRGPEWARVQSSVCLLFQSRASFPVKEFHNQWIGIKTALWVQQDSRSQENGTWISNFKSHISGCCSKEGKCVMQQVSLLQLLFSHGKQPSAATKRGANCIPFCFEMPKQPEIASCSKMCYWFISSCVISCICAG